METILVALPPKWKNRLSAILARRGHVPRVLKHSEGVEELLRGDEPVLAVLPAEGSAEEALRIGRRLRDRQPGPKLQILMCVSAPPDKESWPAFKNAGVNFFLPADFTDEEMAFRVAVAEFTALSTSPTGNISPPPGREIEFSPDTENVPYGVFISTLDNRFLKVNDGLVNILGYSSKEELLQVDIARDIYLDARERAWLLASIPPHNKTLEVVWRRRDGTPVTLLLSGHYALDEASRTVHLQGTAWDITAQRRSEELLRMQRDLGVALSQVGSLDEMHKIILDAVMRIEGIDCCGIYRVEEETRTYRLAAHRGLSSEGAATAALASPDLPLVARCEKCFPIYICKEEFDPVVAEWCRAEGVISQAILPLVHNGKAIAALILGTRTREEIPPTSRIALESIAMQVGGSIARAHAEEALIASRRNLQTFFDTISDMVVIADRQGYIQYFNASVLSNLGYAAEELKNEHVSKLHPAETLQKAMDDFAQGIAGTLHYAKLSLLTKTGRVLPMEVRSGLGTWAGRQAIFGVFHDCTEQEAAHKALEQSEARFRAIFKNASVGIGLNHMDGRILDVNEALAGMQGRTREEIVGHHFREFTTTEDAEIQERFMRDITEGRIQSFELEKRYIHKNGAHFWVRIHCSAVPFPPGEKPQFSIAVVENIDARKRAEEALRESERRYRLIAENASDVVWTARWAIPDLPGGLPADADPQAVLDVLLRGWRYEYISPSVEKVLGFSAEESMMNTPVTHMDPAWHPTAAKIFLDNLADQATAQTYEFPLLAKDGAKRWCEVTINVVPTAPGEPLQLMGILRDITEKKNAAQAILDEQKLLRRLIDLQERERRFLSYEIHDGFAQQITGALFHLDAFKRSRGNDDSQAEKNLERTAAMLRRSIDETRRLISGLRPPILDESGILAAIEYLVCEFRERSGIDIMFMHDLRAVRLAPPLESAVFRIVQESLANACRHSGSDFIRVELNRSDERLEIVVFDEGAGFDPAAVPEDRFGLRSIRERARLLGGEARVESAPGDGCCVRAYLPLVLAELG